MDTNLFFPATSRRDLVNKAAKVCGQCPVIDDCRAHADQMNERYGVWAGEKRSPGGNRQRRTP